MVISLKNAILVLLLSESVLGGGGLDLLWGVGSIPAVPEASASDPTRVLATVYEIGGPLTNVLSTSVAKQLPLIPHIGICCYGTEYFYSDHIEGRTVPVMEEMLGDRPQARLGGGAAVLSSLLSRHNCRRRI